MKKGITQMFEKVKALAAKIIKKFWKENLRRAGEENVSDNNISIPLKSNKLERQVKKYVPIWNSYSFIRWKLLHKGQVIKLFPIEIIIL